MKMKFSVAVDVFLCNLATSLRFHVVVSAAGETADRQADKLISNTPLRASQCRALTRMLMSGLRRQPMERLSDYSVERQLRTVAAGLHPASQDFPDASLIPGPATAY